MPRRRIAFAAALFIVVGFGTGCRSIHTPWSKVQESNPNRPLDAPEVRTARDAVPDSVMLKDRDRGAFSDFSQ